MSTEAQDAAENLRVIRNLMQRATVYRAISAPTAIVAAFSAIAACIFLFFVKPDSISPLGFYALWSAVLIFVDGFNTWLLWRDAKKREAELVTPQLVHAVTFVIPPLLAGAVLSFWVVEDSFIDATAFWALFYGLALLACHSFAPTSMKWLGGLVCGAGILAFAFPGVVDSLADQISEDHHTADLRMASAIMFVTFGLSHLIYGIIVGRKTKFRVSGDENTAS